MRKKVMVVKPPQTVKHNEFEVRLFLAGSIENGKAEDWQSKLIAELEVLAKLDINITAFNPRRDFWNPSWSEDHKNKNLRAQIKWELEHLDSANVIALYLQPGTISPISLLEMGLCNSKRIIVCCPEGYFRKANVDVTCEMYKIPLTENWDDFVRAVKNEIKHMHAIKEYLKK